MTTTVTGISDTPTEIVQKILDFLHDDNTSLYSASLVSREWVPTTRHHLFQQAILNEIRIPYRSTIQENVHAFLALAQSEHCTILPAIQCIVLNVTSPELIEDVVRIFTLSKALTQIVFMDITPSASISWIAHALPNIQDFTFNTWSTFGDDTCRLITSFSHLHSLAVYTNAHTTTTFPSVISGSTFHNLRILRLRLVDSEDLFDWLEKLDGSPSTLEILDLRIFRSCHRGWGSVTALNSILKRNSDTLKDLSMGIDYSPNVKADPLNEGSQIDLSPLVNLRSLFLRTHDVNAVCESITSISSFTALEVLTVNALPWVPDWYSWIKECDCTLLELLAKLVSILEGKNCKMLNLNIPEVLRLDDVAAHLTERRQSGALKLTMVVGDDDQLNTLNSIRHLILKREHVCS